MKNLYFETDAWRSVDWIEVKSAVIKTQYKIYDASKNDNKKQLHKLQKTLVTTRNAKLLALYKVNQNNNKKQAVRITKTAKLTLKQLITIVNNLTIDGKTNNIRKIYTQKSNEDQTYICVSSIKDKAKQELLKLALEPEWEAHFEPNSYGFRPGRCSQDARATVYEALKRKNKYVFSTNI